MQEESLSALEWPSLGQQVASFTSTSMAAERILQQGLHIGATQVSVALVVCTQRSSHS